MKRNLLVALAVLSFVIPAFADDLTPPPWRGAPHSDFQHWMFTQPTNPFPELWHNPYGTPQMTSTGGATWLPTFEGREGVYCLPPNSTMSWHIPDEIDPTMIKLIRIQFTYFLPGGGVLPPLGNPTDVGYTPLPGGWTHMRIDYQEPCQPFDVLLISGNEPIYLDQLVVDAICVPEPGAIAGLMGAVGMLALKRRRK